MRLGQGLGFHGSLGQKCTYGKTIPRTLRGNYRGQITELVRHMVVNDTIGYVEARWNEELSVSNMHIECVGWRGVEGWYARWLMRMREGFGGQQG